MKETSFDALKSQNSERWSWVTSHGGLFQRRLLLPPELHDRWRARYKLISANLLVFALRFIKNEAPECNMVAEKMRIC